ncbi:hypothetical protein [Afifella pfennigii]|uniref:hypothetical protein n=1 Tax=Afifella pfennigii TaxID=209897 RepID=UPI0004787FF8|nr:hypothetical protein [Afifella pfennigii]
MANIAGYSALSGRKSGRSRFRRAFDWMVWAREGEAIRQMEQEAGFILGPEQLAQMRRHHRARRPY